MPPRCTVGLYQACRDRWHFLPLGMYEDCDDDDGDGDDDDFDDDDGVQSERSCLKNMTMKMMIGNMDWSPS